MHFLDSGDYHYLTRLWTARIGRPYALVLLDNHPDMQAPVFPGVMSCGGWVRDILAGDPFCRKVLVVGTDPALAGESCSWTAVFRPGCSGVKPRPSFRTVFRCI